MTRKQLMLEVINDQCNSFQRASEYAGMPMRIEFKEFWAPENHGKMMVHFGSTKSLLKYHEVKEAYFCELWVDSKAVMKNMWVPETDDNKFELEEHGINWAIGQLVLNGINNLVVNMNHP